MKFGIFRIILSLGLFAFACQPAIQPLPEHLFRQMMDFEIAQDIAEKCPNLQMTTHRKAMHLQIDSALETKGLSPEDIMRLKRQAYVGWGEGYKNAYSRVVPIAQEDLDYWCKYGVFEQGRRSAIGLLLTKN